MTAISFVYSSNCANGLYSIVTLCVISLQTAIAHARLCKIDANGIFEYSIWGLCNEQIRYIFGENFQNSRDSRYLVTIISFQILCSVSRIFKKAFYYKLIVRNIIFRSIRCRKSCAQCVEIGLSILYAFGVGIYQQHTNWQYTWTDTVTTSYGCKNLNFLRVLRKCAVLLFAYDFCPTEGHGYILMVPGILLAPFSS